MLVRIRVLGWRTGEGAEPGKGEGPERADIVLGTWTWREETKGKEKLLLLFYEFKIAKQIQTHVKKTLKNKTS